MPKRRKILFVCTGNSCRSQMAEGFMRHYGGDRFEVYSAGTHPAREVQPRAMEVMKEKGIDISRQYPKGLPEVPLQEADVVITMGCCPVEDVCPVSYSGDERDWDLPDPVGQPIEAYRRVRDEIERRIKTLVEELEELNVK